VVTSLLDSYVSGFGTRLFSHTEQFDLNNSIRAARARVFLAVVAESGDVAARVRLEELKGEPAWLAKRGQAGEGEWNADE
jgi:hypothetical protein